MYELRIYEHVEGCADQVRERFEKEVATRFPDHGIELLGAFTDEATGMLNYLTRFPDAEAREKAWGSFGSDAGWLAAKAASETDGPLIAKQHKSVLLPVMPDLPLT
nr:NIPSNAP family protein [Oceanicola sp. 502str15]